MQSVRKPWWQQATAIVSLGAGGAVTGLSFVPRAPAEMKSPSNMLIRLLAQEKPARPAHPAAADDAALRSAIVNVASHYLRMATGKTPAEMEALIWQRDSVDGVDHGESCAAFASLTLELAAQAVGQQSWVTGGTSYPWPLESWADVRVDPNPASPTITSVLQDAQAHGRWHPLGDGYVPRPGDWVLFPGHVEVVTQFSGGFLRTIGGDSLPNFSVNAHAYSDPLGAQGVVGFVNNGQLGTTTASQVSAAGAAGGQARGRSDQAAQSGQAAQAASPGGSAAAPQPARAQSADDAAIPGMPGPSAGPGASSGRAAGSAVRAAGSRAASPGPAQRSRRDRAPTRTATLGETAIPGLPTATPSPAAARPAAAPATDPPSTGPASSAAAPAREIGVQQAFISQVVPGAVAAQHRYGVPASVTIAQAIDESGWGLSGLAIRDHNLFGIKGSGPAGSDPQPTQEFQNGESVTRTALFRVYHDVAESIDDHGKLLATSGYYRRAMADRQDPNAFAVALTGVYATDPDYGAKLVGLMQQYDLYRYDNAASAAAPRAAQSAAGAAAPRARKSAATPSPAKPTVSPSAASPSAPAPVTSPSAATSSPAMPTASPTAATVSPTPGPAAGSGVTAPAAATPPASAPRAARSRAARSGGASPSPADSASARPSGARPGAARPGQTRTGAPTAAPAPGTAAIPGLPPAAPVPSADPAPPAAAPIPTPAARRQTDAYQASPGVTATETMFVTEAPVPASHQPRRSTAPASRPPRPAGAGTTSRAARAARSGPTGRAGTALYLQHLPPAAWNAFNTTAKGRLTGEEALYRDVASHSGIRWELLAACDWMQCEARSRYSPVHGEKLGSLNPDGTVYRTKSAALEQCGDDLADLAWEVYQIDLTADQNLSVRDLARAFAAFRWGGLLKLHRTSAMEFPYSVAGLTPQHVGMRWPNIDEPNAPDKPGSRFRRPFGAVPVVLGLNYPATA